MPRLKRDHFEKMFISRQIESLDEYLIVNQDPAVPQAWVYRRANAWAMPTPITSGEFELSRLNLRIRLEDLYAA